MESNLSRLEEIIKMNKASNYLKKGSCILRIDIDNLRAINANKGNKHGDIIIDKAYECIKNALSKSEKFYWIAGGDFVVLSNGSCDRIEAEELYNRIQKSAMETILENDYEFYFSLCCGIVLIDDDAEVSYSEMAKRAEFALTNAKEQGINVCSVFYQNKYKKSIENYNLKIDLQKAINNNFEGFKAAFQPILDKNLKVIGAECLLRFEQDGKSISPVVMVPLLEETGFIVPVGNWILGQALDFCKKAVLIDKDFLVSINMSYMEAKEYNKLIDILYSLEDYGIASKNLSIELTESGCLESTSSTKRLWKVLSEIGVTVCIDDFGTGFSNFNYIWELNPDILKLDFRVVRNAMENEKKFAVLKAISKAAEILDLKICLEGIETEEHFNKMKTLEPEFYQGFYFGKPCSEKEFMDKFLC